MAQKATLGSLATGFVLGSLVGWYVGRLVDVTQVGLISNITLFQSTLFTLTTFGIMFGLLFVYFASKKPVFIELLAYAISVYVILQFAWDSVVEPVIGPDRYYLLIHAGIMFITNSLGGRIKLAGGTSIFKRALGL